MLSKQALDEYREIYRREHGEVPTDEVLTEEAIKLLTVFDLIYRPVKKVWLEEYERRRNNTTDRWGYSLVQEKANSPRIPQSKDRGTQKAD